MIKNNKKTIIALLTYSLILIGAILAFVFVIKTKDANSTIELYFAKDDILGGTLVEENFSTSYLNKTKVHESVYNDIVGYDAKPLKSSNYKKIEGQTVLSDIKKGSVILESQFGKIVTLETMDMYKQKYGFEEPYYSVLNVDETNATISGFEEGQLISIEGKIDLSVFNKSQEYKEDASEVLNGIICNKCIVHNLVYDTEKKLKKIGVVVELSEYPVINYIETYGSLKFHEGKLALWETTNKIIMENLWEKTGFKDGLAKELTTYLKYENSKGEEIKKNFCAYSNTIYTNTTITNFLDVSADSKVSLYTPYKNIIVSHYNFDGSNGKFMDISGSNLEKTFESTTGLYNMNFDSEGLYTISFYENAPYNYGTDEEPDWGQKYSKVNEIKFTIEMSTENQKENNTLGLNVGYNRVRNFEEVTLTSCFERSENQYVLKANSMQDAYDHKLYYKVLIDENTSYFKEIHENQMFDVDSAPKSIYKLTNEIYTISGFETSGSISKSYFEALKTIDEIDLFETIIFDEKFNPKEFADFSLFIDSDTPIGIMGDRTIKQINIKVGDDVIDIVTKNESGLYKKASNEQKAKLISILGNPSDWKNENAKEDFDEEAPF